ncbi:hypothetical protein [Sphingopyxis sp.]
MQRLTDFMVATSSKRMGRPRINAEGEKITARFREGTLGRIKAVLREKEKQSDFVRDAVEAALEARETLDKISGT